MNGKKVGTCRQEGKIKIFYNTESVKCIACQLSTVSDLTSLTVSGRAQKELAENKVVDWGNGAGLKHHPPLSPLIVLPAFSLPYL